MKLCSSCKTTKELVEFGKYKLSSDGYMYICKKCNNIKSMLYAKNNPEKVKESFLKSRQKCGVKKYSREERKKHILKSKFGLTIEVFKEMLDEQMGVCAICSQPEITLNKDGTAKSLSVDHCHTTGKVRGLLCNSCNYALGCFKDNIFLLDSAFGYLKTFHQNKEET